jgi:hypothetical protein
MAHFFQFILQAIVILLTGQPKWIEQKPKWFRVLWAVLLPFFIMAVLLAAVIFAGNAVRGVS